ncbi:tyrosine-type recombinase/integrase [Massilia frigida]|uniref:tyrosine-type recombinase/integrase n=1 Tax=Massilia frigida TaxID=2609281 RepID=UPI001CB71055|nr:tyrosine-type recombinase/integrase [Massilia frigida]
MTRFGIHRIVTHYGALAATSIPTMKDKRVSPHLVRHMTAIHLLRAGVDINTIRAWLGHVPLDTTNIYAEADLEMKAHALAGDIRTLTTWLAHDVLALAGPNLELRKDLFDFIVAELGRRESRARMGAQFHAVFDAVAQAMAQTPILPAPGRWHAGWPVTRYGMTAAAVPACC